MRKTERRIALIACFSRIFILCLTVFGYVFGVSYDSSTKALLEWNKSSTVLEAFVRWDSVYFLSIAQKGYVYEHEFAFFPGYPLLMHVCMRVLSVLLKWTSLSALQLYIISGLFISNISFITSSIILYKLGKFLLKDETLAYMSSIFWIFNPSGVFLSSLYSESLFALLTFLGMLNYAHKRVLLASVLWGASSFVRGNGVISSGFLIWSLLKSRDPIWKIGLGIWFVWIPFLGFQLYGHELICHLQRPFCDQFPYLIYTFVQKEYWNNGFLNYYQWKQVPNFLLASPFLSLSLYGIAVYYSRDPLRFLSLRFYKSETKYKGFESDELLPFVYLWMFLTAVVTLFMHVQIILRFFTSLPILYWFIASISMRSNRANYILLGYFVLYCIVGTVLFSLFYPPA